MHIAILHPGAMGCRVGATASGVVHWASDGRSAASRQRAADAGLVEMPTVADVVEACRVVVSVCPPHAALDLARTVAALGFGGTYVDANAISPAEMDSVAAALGSGARVVDGGIVGPPPVAAGTTRLYLSGPGASDVATIWDGSALDARVVGDRVGAASALKMAYASWTKGSAALLIAARAVAAANGVDDALVAEWELSIPDVADRLPRAAAGVGPKAWRFEGEMREIAATYAAADLPAGFHEAAADLYRRLAGFKNQPPPTVDAVIEAILEGTD